MANRHFIIADIGASNGRITRGTFDGKTLGLEMVHRFENIPVAAGKHLYWDYLNIYREIKKGIAAAASGHDITSMATDTWNVDFALIGKDGKLILNPLHYRDESRSDPILKDLYKEISIDGLFNITGWNPAYLVSAPYYLYYLKKNYRYIIKNTLKFLMMPDLFNYFLTGEYFTEYSIASGSIMLDYKTGTWDERLLGLCGLEKDMMPAILDSGVYASGISEAVCSELGIETFKVSTCASHDTASAVAGIPAKGKDFAFLGTGTWFILGIETKEKIMRNGVIKGMFSNEGGASGSNFFAKNTSAGFWILQECRKKWNKSHGKEYSWDEIVGFARGSGSIKSVIDVEDPAFSAGNQDMPGLIRDFCRETGQEIPETIGETAYIIFTSLAFTVKKYLVEMEEFTGISIDTLHMIGGGVYNTLLCQLIANTTGVIILAGPAEAASMGNLIMQLKAAGDIKDVAEGREIISGSIEIKEYYPGEEDHWKEEYRRFSGIIENRHNPVR
jgi:rhamnulokinase